jgi:hypothetical protein
VLTRIENLKRLENHKRMRQTYEQIEDNLIKKDRKKREKKGRV